MNTGSLYSRVFSTVFLAAVTLLIVAPILCVMLVSFSSTPVFDLPTNGISFQWYAQLMHREKLWPAIGLSVQVAIVSTAISLALGTLCSLGLIRAKGYLRDIVLSVILSPMMLPGVVLGIAMLFSFRQAGLFDSYLSLMLAHVVITLPYIIRIVYSALELFDFSLLDAARILGCTHVGAVRRILIPVLAPSFFTGAMFAFITSFDNYALALFLSDVDSTTLPLLILQFIEYGTDPSIAALATLMVTLTAAIFFIGERLVGLQRLVK